MPSAGLRFRRTLRGLREKLTPVQLAAIGTAIALIAVLVVVAVQSGSDSEPAADSQEVASGDAAPGGTDTTAAPGETVPGETTPEGEPVAPGGGGESSSAGGGGDAGGSGAASGGTDTTVPSGGGSATTTVSTTKPRVLTASDRGVTPTSVKIVFPWFEFDQAGKITGTVADIENQENAIKAYVDYFNATGGIGGRKIEPIIVEFNPVNDPDMRAKCIEWADDDKVFGVVDSEAWHSGHQLCLTQEKDTPLVTSYTTINEWTKRGAPYLWWTGPSAEDVVENWVLWAKERNLLNTSIGVVLTDREEDKVVKRLMEDALGRVKVSAHFEVLPYDNAGAASAVAMPGAVQRMKDKAQRVFMLLPFTQFKGWLTTAEAQDYYPKYLFSDLGQTLIVAEAIFASQHPRSLNGALGPSYARLGEREDPPRTYDATEKKCNDIWQKAYPRAEPMNKAGVAARWCQNISVFVEAARRATEANNGVLTRKGWGEAMATIRDFGGAMTPVLSWAPGDHAGPTRMKVAMVSTDAGRCEREMNDTETGGCLIQTEAYAALRRF